MVPDNRRSMIGARTALAVGGASQGRQLYRRRRQARLPLAPAICALCITTAMPLGAQVSSIEDAGDDVAITEFSPSGLASASAGAAGSEASGGPVRLSLLDIAAKLAVLVLAVYGIAWGAKLARQRGLRLPGSGGEETCDRLVNCAELPLRGGASLHVVEVDEQPVLLATHGSGEVSLLLDLRAPEPMPTTQGDAVADRREAAPTDALSVRASSILQADSDWEERRDSLIRALAQQS